MEKKKPEHNRIEEALDRSEPAWSLCFIGENHASKLRDLIKDLTRQPSPTGDGKTIASGFAYWGLRPTIAWQNACDDPSYPVMQESIKSFRKLWQQTLSKLTDSNYHYVSLGVGTGDKDHHILRDVHHKNPSAFYIPVDMSPEMLIDGAQRAIDEIEIKPSKVILVQIDFSYDHNVGQLRNLLDQILGDDPVLFSLLGNTLSNFDDDRALLQTLSRLVRYQDRLMLEVATTNNLERDAQLNAASEYEGSQKFREFIASALKQNTKLEVDLANISFDGTVENDKAIIVKTHYRNNTQKDIPITLANGLSVSFPVNDTIRLSIARKYTIEGIGRLLTDCKFSCECEMTNEFPRQKGRNRFGTSLLLLPLPSNIATKRELDAKGPAKLTTDIPEGPKTQTLLFITAYPENTERIKSNTEARVIREQLIEKSKNRDLFAFETCLATGTEELINALDGLAPAYVHFSAHGTIAGELCLETESGGTQLVNPRALANLFEGYANHIRCVVLNTCYSKDHAERIAKHIPFVIGMDKSLDDHIAVSFAGEFYRAIGDGKDIKEAFEKGCKKARLDSKEDEPRLPELFPKPDLG